MEINSAALWLNTFFASFDEAVTQFIHDLFFPCSNFFTPFFEYFSLLGKGGIFLILISFILMLFKKTRKCGTAMLISIAIGFLFTNCCFKILIARPRPYVDTDGFFYNIWLTVGQNMESDKSFPSGHTTAAFSTMTAVFLTCNKKYSWTAFIFAIIMGIARIYLVVHYPTDVIGGIIVGVAAALITTLVIKLIPDVYFQKELFNKKVEV